MILCAFAGVIGSLTVHRIRQDFNREVLEKAERLPSELNIEVVFTSNGDEHLVITPGLGYFTAPSEHAVIRIFGLDHSVLAESPSSSPWFGPPERSAQTLHNYRVLARSAAVRLDGVERGQVFVQYAKSVDETEATVRRVELFLLLGVLAGTALALLAGLAIARRAMKPITELTSSAAEIARTRDPSREIPQPAAEDEVAKLARTLQGMLYELDDARNETEATLARQRQFVADASHELRTPLTSVLANLELLAETLDGDQGDAASSALRSSRRMRRLVADLLLLARNDAAKPTVRENCDLGQIAVEAAGELGALADGHEIVIDAKAAPCTGSGTSSTASASTCSRTRSSTRRRAPRSVSAPPPRRRAWSSWWSKTTARASPPSSPKTCSSASYAGPGTAAARSVSGWRSCRRSRPPTAARSRSSPRCRERAPASWSACRRAQTSTTTGRTIGRRFRRS